MSSAAVDTWSKRYRIALDVDVVKQRATQRGVRVEGLKDFEIEIACGVLENGLKSVLLVTSAMADFVRMEAERALGYCEREYRDPRSVFQMGYSESAAVTPQLPTLLTGLAGVGKSQLRRAIAAVFDGRAEISIDPYHPSVPLIDFADCIVKGRKSVAQILRPFAGPEIAAGNVRVSEAELPGQCAKWLRTCGTCLLGADEFQFIAQSDNASALISQALLAISDVGVPWFAIANYSMCWKLLDRPSEAKQRILARPYVLFPDHPDSTDWAALLDEYSTVGGDAFAFDLRAQFRRLWNLCAGLKRELVKLLVHAYRVARMSGRYSANWNDVEHAFGSVWFSAARTDINLLIAHAVQGGVLPKHLRCPFEGAAGESSARFVDSLRSARTAVVAQAVIHSSLNASEKAAFARIEAEKSSGSLEPAPGAGEAVSNVVPLKRRRSGKRDFDALLDAGRRGRERRGLKPPAE